MAWLSAAWRGWVTVAWLPVINVMAMWVGGNESEIF